MKLTHKVLNDSDLKSVLKNEMQISRKLFKELRDNACIKINSKTLKYSYDLLKGDLIEIDLGYEKNTYEPYEYDLEVVYEDEVLLVVNKDKNMVVHPTNGVRDKTLLNAIANHQLKNNENYKIRFLNRIDRDTTGIVVVTKDKWTHSILNKMLSEREFYKEYHAIIHGKLEEDITIEMNMARGNDILREENEDGKYSKTVIKPIKYNENYTLVKAIPITGRTHQIRVHLQSINHPIVGDPLYGIDDNYKYQFLHSKKFEIYIPHKKEKMILESNYKKEFIDLLEEI